MFKNFMNLYFEGKEYRNVEEFMELIHKYFYENLDKSKIDFDLDDRIRQINVNSVKKYNETTYRSNVISLRSKESTDKCPLYRVTIEKITEMDPYSNYED